MLEAFWVGLVLNKEKEIIYTAACGLTRNEVVESCSEQFPNADVFCFNLTSDMGMMYNRTKNWLERNGVPENETPDLIIGIIKNIQKMGEGI